MSQRAGAGFKVLKRWLIGLVISRLITHLAEVKLFIRHKNVL